VKISKIFLAYEEGAFGKASFDASKAIFGKQFQIDGAPFKSALLGGSDYSGMLEAAKAYKPDLFLWAGYAQDAIAMLEAAKAMKFSPPIYLGAPPGWPADMAKQPLANNVMLPEMKEASMAKAFVGHEAFHVVSESLQMFGAAGYSSALPLERMLRDVRMFQIGGGTSQAQLNMIARSLFAGR